MIVLGILGFIIIALGDYNDALLKNKLLKISFPVGFLLIAAATALNISRHFCFSLAWTIFAAVFLAALIYALFGSFNTKDAYVKAGGKPEVYTKGLYSLCRHPGVLCFIGLYACLCPALGLSMSAAITYSALNVILAAYEDYFIFPKTLSGYDAYKREVPFIVPRIKK